MADKLDLREKGGPRAGGPQFSDRRLFLQLLVFADCNDTGQVTEALEMSGHEGVLYEDASDPSGVALLAWSDSPDYFLGPLRARLQQLPFNRLRLRPEFTMLGRSYALGHEPDLDDWLLDRPRRTVTADEARWAVWYPLRRAGAFAALAADERTAILREHGAVGHSFGGAGLAQDVRLACFGLDRHDNDFVIGLIGAELFPLSACVEAMRRTRQTSNYIQRMGPFFIGRRVWRRLATPKL